MAGVSAWTRTTIRDTSCCDHPLTGVWVLFGGSARRVL